MEKELTYNKPRISEETMYTKAEEIRIFEQAIEHERKKEQQDNFVAVTN